MRRPAAAVVLTTPSTVRSDPDRPTAYDVAVRYALRTVGVRRRAEATGVQTNLGRCHYGRDDDATMIGVRADGPGWVGVCSRHRDDAEGEGYVLHELCVAEQERAPSTQSQPQSQSRATYEQVEQPAHEPSVGLDILDEPYPLAPEDRPIR